MSGTFITVTGQCLSTTGASADLQFWSSNVAGGSGGVLYIPTFTMVSTDANGNWSVNLLSTDTANFVYYCLMAIDFLGEPGRPATSRAATLQITGGIATYIARP